MRDSSLNPEYVTWRSAPLQLEPIEPPKEREAPLLACYRKEFTLPAAARQAALTVYLQTSRTTAPYWITVNGQALSEPREGALQLAGLTNLDATKVLRAGRNVITVKRACTLPAQAWLTVEGIVFCEDGSTRRGGGGLRRWRRIDKNPSAC
ncbi:MAG: hypothetical protein HY321_04985 [Armatimonadetes bacterium]|nr:hypothetical protein [Armatimonadota bacterium]